jgi:UDP-2,3-diacylglucosamine pyrophosphatase LpxH
VPETSNQNKSYDHDIVVLSDLHLGEGLHKSEPRFSPTEDFFCDQQFANFLAHLEEKYKDDPSRLLVVLNGDALDFLTVTRVPTDKEAKERGFRVTSAEKKFGLNPTAEKSVFKLDTIVDGHQVFFRSLARFLKLGFRAIILPGNHDLELYFKEVRERLIERLAGFEDGPDKAALRESVSFLKWFYVEPGRVYIEHGNQYDSANSIRYPLRPLLPKKRWWKAEEEETLDYPLGSIFVRFFYNRVRRIDPYTPRLLSFEQYLDFIRRYNLFDVWRIYRDHYPHFVQALGPMTTTGTSRSTEEEDERQERDFDELLKNDEHGSLYRGLSKLKINPASASKPYVVKELVTPMIRRTLWLVLFAFVALFIWFGIFQLIDEIPWVTANAFLMSLFAFATLGAGLWSWIHFNRKMRMRSADSAAAHFVDRAEKIAELADVPMVLMGHTHMVDFRRVDGGRAAYANSGTWTSVNNPWNRIMRDARRLTFLYVKGDEVEINRWNDDAGRIDDVPLFYFEDDDIPDKLSYETPYETTDGSRRSLLPSAALGEEDDDFSLDKPPPPFTR